MLAIVLVGSSKRPYESRLSTAFTETTTLFSKTTQWKEIFEHKHERQKKKKKEYRFHKYTVPEWHGQGRPGDEQHDLAKHRH